MDTTINERIREIADKLCRGNISELSRVSGVNQPALREIVGIRQRKPGFEILQQIAECPELHINSVWLLTPKGDMQTPAAIDIIHHPPYHDARTRAIPIYDITAAANLQTLFSFVQSN